MEQPGPSIDIRGSINGTSEPVCASPGSKVHMKFPAEDLGGRANGVGRLRKMRTAWSSLVKGTIFSSIFTLLTTCIGAGTLSLPYAFEQGGLIPASGIFFLIMIVSIIVGLMLLAAKRYCEELYPGMAVWGYEDLAVASFGPIGKIIVLLTLIVLLFLSLIAYMIYTRDQLDLIVQFALSQAGHVPTCSPLVNCAVLMSIAFIPIFPITLLRNLTPMQVTSTFSILCIGYVGVTMFIKMIIYQKRDQDHQNVDLGPQGFQGVLVTITYCSLSFVCHFNLLPLQKELYNPTKKRMNIIMIGSMVLAYALYNLVIFSGLFTFYDALKEDVMLNYPRDDILITTARIALFFTLLFSYPVLLHPTRAAINRLLLYVYHLTVARLQRKRSSSRDNEVRSVQDKEYSDSEDIDRGEETSLLSKTPSTTPDAEVKIPMSIWISETWLLFATTFLAASYIPNVGLVWNFVGSIGGTLVLYIFPPAFFLRLRWMRYIHHRQVQGISVQSQYSWSVVVREVVALVIMIVGCLLLVAENYSAVEAILQQPNLPNDLCSQAKCGSMANLSSVFHNNV